MHGYFRQGVEAGVMTAESETRVDDWWSHHPRLLSVFHPLVFAGREASIRRTAVDAAHATLRPGGRLAVLDARPFQHFPLTRLTLLLVPVFEAVTNWVSDVDVPAVVDDRFDGVEVTNVTDGTLFVATGRKR